MENNQQKIDDILEIVTFIKDHAMTKEEGVTKKEFDERMDTFDERMDTFDERLTKIEATMVTKDYLDEKLGRLKGDLVIEMRGFNQKLTALVDILRTRKVISDDEAKHVLSMEPFPQLFVS